MKQNTDGIDRTFRILLGIGVLAIGAYYQSYWGAIGLVPLLTGLIGWCPAYLPFGVSTCKIKQ